MSFTLVALAAGRATRYGSPKQLVPMGPRGETLLEYAVYDALRVGCGRVVLVVRPDLAAAFRDHVARTFGPALDVAFALQQPARGRSTPWGTGEAVLTAAGSVDGDFLVANADDHYGPSAFRTMAESLRAPRTDETFGLAGYRLAHTLSPSGGVSRAVCAVADDGYLTGLREIRDVARGEDGGIVGRELDDAVCTLASDETVSMNLWAFTQAVFPLLGAAFDAFRRTARAGRTSEFLLSAAIDRMIQRGTAHVRVIPTAERAVGVTVPDDRPWVARRMQQLTEEGTYPAPLWRSASPAGREV